MATQAILCAFVIYCCVSFGNGQVPGFGACPQLTLTTEFDPVNFAGKWYYIERYFPILYELGLECGTTNFTYTGDGRYNVLSKGFNTFFRTVSTMRGELFAPDADQPCKMIIDFPQFSTIARGNYWILDTDYTNYALVYGCNSLLPGIVHTDTIWILGRKKMLDSAVMEKLYNMLETQGLRTTFLRPAVHNDCPF